MVGRERSSVRMAILKPSPSSPSRFSTGISQSEKCRATVGEPWIPSFFSFLPTENPFMPGSTRNAVMPRARLDGSVAVNSEIIPAWEPLVTHIFEPLTT